MNKLKCFFFYLKHLMKWNLISFHHRKNTYMTTQRGKSYTDMVRVLESLIDFPKKTQY